MQRDVVSNICQALPFVHDEKFQLWASENSIKYFRFRLPHTLHSPRRHSSHSNPFGLKLGLHSSLSPTTPRRRRCAWCGRGRPRPLQPRVVIRVLLRLRRALCSHPPAAPNGSGSCFHASTLLANLPLAQLSSSSLVSSSSPLKLRPTLRFGPALIEYTYRLYNCRRALFGKQIFAVLELLILVVLDGQAVVGLDEVVGALLDLHGAAVRHALTGGGGTLAPLVRERGGGGEAA